MHMEYNNSHSEFRSYIIKSSTDNPEEFVRDVLSRDVITAHIQRGQYFEGLYTLAMVEYLQEKLNMESAVKYDSVHYLKLSKAYFPASIIKNAETHKDSVVVYAQAANSAIPSFMQFNIVETKETLKEF